ncbi:dienelactone hydrolase-like protein [Aureococcus anophagefferens]|nr:dienelactone hydrolase-like protein [Aureococcus anophagefferens]
MGGPQNHWQQRGGYGAPGGFQGRGGGRGRGGGGRGRGRGQGDADDGVVDVDICEIVGQHNDTRNEKRIVVATNHRRLVSHAPDTMIFAYHVCNVSEKTAPPVVEAGQKTRPSVAVAPAAAGSAAPAASEAAPIALGDANTTPSTAANTAPLTVAADTAPSTAAHESGVAAAAQRARRKVPEARKRKNANGVDRVKRYHGLPLLYDGESKLFSSVGVRLHRGVGPGRRAGSFVVAAPAPGGRRV